MAEKCSDLQPDSSGWVNPRRHRKRRSELRRPPPTRPLHRSPVQVSPQPYFRSFSPAAPPSPNVSDDELWAHRKPDISRWGNLIRHTATDLKDPGVKLAGDVGFGPLHRSPPVASNRSVLDGDGPAGCVGKTWSPEKIDAGRSVDDSVRVLDDSSCSEMSPVLSLEIATADQGLWEKHVAEADRWAHEMWPDSDQ